MPRLLALALLLCGCASVPSPNPAPSSVAEDFVTRPAVRGLIGRELTASGNLTADPASQGQVGAPASGRLAELFVTPGQRVRVGQALARLHGADLTRARSAHQDAVLRLRLAERTLEQRRQQARLGDAARRPVEEARAELASSRGDEEVARSARVLAGKKLARARDLFAHDIISQRDLEEAEAADEQAASRWRQARDAHEVARGHERRETRLADSGSLVTTRVLEAEHEVEIAREEVQHTREVLTDLGLGPHDEGLILRAPMAGVVIASRASLGQAVAADDLLFEILDPSRLWLWLYVYEDEQRQVRRGQTVIVEVAGQTRTGRIDYIPPRVETPARTLGVRVTLRNPEGDLRVGMAARARIQLEKPHQAVLVPARAVVGGKVFIGDRREPRSVTVGEKRDDLVEIVTGVRAGEEVVVEGAQLL